MPACCYSQMTCVGHKLLYAKDASNTLRVIPPRLLDVGIKLNMRVKPPKEVIMARDFGRPMTSSHI